MLIVPMGEIMACGVAAAGNIFAAERSTIGRIGVIDGRGL